MKAIALGMLVVAVFSVPAAVSAQKPVKEELIHIDSGPPPSTAAGMASAAAAIVVARYTGVSRLIERTFSDDARVPALKFTAYTFQIAEILKLHQYLPFAGSEMEVELLGGDKEYPTYILRERDRDTELLKQDHTYVLFLVRDSTRDNLGLAWGSAAIYDVTDGRVTSLHRHGRYHDGTPAATFVAALRAAAK